MGGIPDSISQSQLHTGVHGCHHDAAARRHQGNHKAHGRVQGSRRDDKGSRRQRIVRGFRREQERRDTLRPRSHKRHRGKCRICHHTGTPYKRSVQEHLRPRGTCQHSQRQPQMPRIARPQRSIGLPRHHARAILRTRRERQHLHRNSQQIRAALPTGETECAELALRRL